MRQSWRQMKRWKKWTISVMGSLLLIVLCISGYLYYQINQIDLQEIQKRVEEQNQNLVADSGQSDELPGILSNTVEKANEMASKSIESQDALDVAAILLKSGLSMKEIYFLLGKSTENLPNEEKQKIRGLLLTKLSGEEIKALRAITNEYGKKLVILDPNYPIELVGVYDEAQRQKIKKELAAKEELPNGNNPKPTASPIPIFNETPSADSKKDSSNTELQKQYSAKLESLQQSCSSQVNVILNELSQSIQTSKQSGKDYSTEAIQKVYLPKVADAETRCDNQFNQMMSEASQAYKNERLALDDITVWNKQYEKIKEQTRNQAMSTLIADISK